MSEIERLIAAFWQESFRMHMERPSGQEEARGNQRLWSFKKRLKVLKQVDHSGWSSPNLEHKSVVLPATKRSVGRSSVKPPCPSEPKHAQQPASTVAVPESSGASENNFHCLYKWTSQKPWTAIWAPTAHVWLRYARIQNWIHADYRQSGCSKSTSQRCGENFVTKSIVRSHSVWHLLRLF